MQFIPSPSQATPTNDTLPVLFPTRRSVFMHRRHRHRRPMPVGPGFPVTGRPVPGGPGFPGRPPIGPPQFYGGMNRGR